MPIRTGRPRPAVRRACRPSCRHACHHLCRRLPRHRPRYHRPCLVQLGKARSSLLGVEATARGAGRQQRREPEMQRRWPPLPPPQGVASAVRPCPPHAYRCARRLVSHPFCRRACPQSRPARAGAVMHRLRAVLSQPKVMSLPGRPRWGAARRRLVLPLPRAQAWALGRATADLERRQEVQ